MPHPNKDNLTNAALCVLRTKDAVTKARLSKIFYQKFCEGKLYPVTQAAALKRPARPDKPDLLHPTKMPKRRASGSVEARIALIHAIAHIELNAIDLAWDMIARFTSYKGHVLPQGYYQDWAKIGMEEAKHFLLLHERLQDWDSFYGALPAHDGLWQSAQDTAENFPARLAVVPMVLEARGLDVTPGMITKMKAVGDDETAAILQIIHDEEIHHVKNGKKWFDWVADIDGRAGEAYWQELVDDYFHGQLKRPFNVDSRNKANFPQDWYEPLAV